MNRGNSFKFMISFCSIIYRYGKRNSFFNLQFKKYSNIINLICLNSKTIKVNLIPLNIVK